jgi:hypothetical protein
MIPSTTRISTAIFTCDTIQWQICTDESMKVDAVTVIFEYGCSRYPQNIGNYPPDNMASHLMGQKHL